MEEIREAALAYYDAGSSEEKGLALKFFNSMDENGDNRVSLHEFTQFLGEQGYKNMNNPDLFRELDKNGDGSLDFCEVLTLYYIAKCRRPFCRGCQAFIKGLFFTCVKCHECYPDSFDLCSSCYRDQNFNHAHTFFVDNFLLLEYKRHLSLQVAANQVQSTNLELVPVQTQASTSGTSTNLQVPVQTQASTSKMEKAKKALVALEKVLSIGTMGFTAVNYCSIM